jgi:hypothetical protein
MEDGEWRGYAYDLSPPPAPPLPMLLPPPAPPCALSCSSRAFLICGRRISALHYAACFLIVPVLNHRLPFCCSAVLSCVRCDEVRENARGGVNEGQPRVMNFWRPGAGVGLWFYTTKSQF